MMRALPRRRWFQFSLRTMFVVVTVFAVWLGWQLKIVNERQAFLLWVENTGGVYGPVVANSGHQDQPQIQFWRIWLGDFGVIVIGLGKQFENDQGKAEEARQLFPEADIYPERPARESRGRINGDGNQFQS